MTLFGDLEQDGNAVVCQFEREAADGPIVRWRRLPLRVHLAIARGKVRDDLTAYPTELGISDCNSMGCWVPARQLDGGCAIVCDGTRACISSP